MKCYDDTETPLREALAELLACIEEEWGADVLPYNLGLDESKRANAAILAARAAVANSEAALRGEGK